MKKIVSALIFSLFCASAWAKPVQTADQAVDLVMKSVEKNRLTELTMECLMFAEAYESSTHYEIDVREKHNAQCGGDPDTAPRLFSYKVSKKTGTLCTDSIEWAEKLKAKDPYDFSCRLIK